MKEFLGGLLGQNMKSHVERKNKVNWNRKSRFALLALLTAFGKNTLKCESQ